MAVQLDKAGFDLGMVTTNGDAMLEFYRDVLGFEVVSDGGQHFQCFRRDFRTRPIATYDRDFHRLLLLTFPASSSFHSPTFLFQSIPASVRIF